MICTEGLLKKSTLFLVSSMVTAPGGRVGGEGQVRDVVVSTLASVNKPSPK